MLNFDYRNPTHIVFGKDRLAELDQLVPANARVLVTYGGGSVKRFGTLDKVITALGDRVVFEFGGIEANPKYDTWPGLPSWRGANPSTFCWPSVAVQ